MTDPSPPNANVARYLTEAARQAPDRPAVVPLEGSPLTFEQLDRMADALARHLFDGGLSRGMRVLLLARPGPGLMAAVYALFRIGAVPVVIDPGMGRRSFLECVRRTAPEAIVGIRPAILLSRLFRRSFRDLRLRFEVDGKAWRRAAAGASAGSGRRRFPAADLPPGAPAAVLFTSGSTGPAKGVCYDHGMLAAQIGLLREGFELRPGTVDFPLLPVFALFNPALGATTVIPAADPRKPASLDPAVAVRQIRENGVTQSFGSPVLWCRIALYCERAGVRLDGLRELFMAGAPVAPSIVRLVGRVAPEARIWIPYGATEALPLTVISGREVLEDTALRTEAGEGTCVGRPLPGIEIAIIAPREGPIGRWEEVTLLPDGVVGEVIARGPVVTQAYDRLPDATRRARIPSIEPDRPAWHRMGDAGYRDEQGRLWFCGRLAERVITSGGVLYTEPVEAIFNRHPAVERSALIGLGMAPRQEPALVVQPVADRFPETRQACRDFAAALRSLGRRSPVTTPVTLFYFRRSFPVDVRHNAKIHRLTLRKEISREFFRKGPPGYLPDADGASMKP